MNALPEKLKSIIESLIDPQNESIKMSMNHVHAPGLFSLVVSGDEFGKLTRIFIATKKLKPFSVQFHTHRYPIVLTSIRGDITHHLAVESEKSPETVQLSEYLYHSFMNGGNGLQYLNEINIKCSDYKIPTGSIIDLGIDDFHTMSCSKGSIWIVEEKGFQEKCSRVLGVPFVVDGLYTKPEMFQINDKIQLVIRELKKINLAYELV